MTPFLQLAFELAIILLAAKAAGYISLRLKQPSVLGELLVGVILGPSLLNILGLPFIHTSTLAESLSQLSELGVLLLMFIAGLDLHLGELMKHRNVSLLASLGGLILSMGLGYAAGRLFGLGQTASFLLGLALAATSVSISARTLMEMGVLRSRVGLSLLGAAVADDVLSILAFSIFLAVSSHAGGFSGILVLILQMALFLVAGTAFGLWVLPWLARGVAKLSISQGPLVFAIVMLLFYGLAAELVGHMAALIGTFLAGLMFARTPEREVIQQGMITLAYALFVPIFFVNIGLSIDLRSLSLNSLWLILVVSAAAIAGKWVGAAAGARLGGMPAHEAVQLGAGMMARGEVTLIIAAAGSSSGLLSAGAFSAIVAAVLVSTLVTPPILHLAFSRLKPKVRVQAEEEASKE